MAKGQVHLGLRHLGSAATQNLARTVAAKLPQSGKFPNPPVSPADLVAAASPSETADADAHQKHQEAIIATGKAHLAHKDLNDKLTLESAYVDHIAQREAVVAEAGSEPKARR